MIRSTGKINWRCVALPRLFKDGKKTGGNVWCYQVVQGWQDQLMSKCDVAQFLQRYQRLRMCGVAQVVQGRQDQLGAHHHAAVLRLPPGSHGASAGHHRLLLRHRHLPHSLRCLREDRQVDRRARGWLGEPPFVSISPLRFLQILDGHRTYAKFANQD